MTIEQVVLILTALGALGAAVAAWLSARATSRAAEGELFATIFAIYGTPEMLRSLRVLRLWKHKKGDEFELKWKKALDDGNEEAFEVDAARRYVKFYFMQILRLYEARYVSRRFLKELADVDGINILYDIVEPLEYAFNPARFDGSRFKLLHELCGRAGTGQLLAPVPLPPRLPYVSQNSSGEKIPQDGPGNAEKQ